MKNINAGIVYYGDVVNYVDKSGRLISCPVQYGQHEKIFALPHDCRGAWVNGELVYDYTTIREYKTRQALNFAHMFITKDSDRAIYQNRVDQVLSERK